jgi:hypothetical protein
MHLPTNVQTFANVWDALEDGLEEAASPTAAECSAAREINKFSLDTLLS